MLRSSNSFSVLSDNSDDCDKENLPPKRIRKPTIKFAETLQNGIAGVTKGVTKGMVNGSKKRALALRVLNCPINIAILDR